MTPQEAIIQHLLDRGCINASTKYMTDFQVVKLTHDDLEIFVGVSRMMLTNNDDFSVILEYMDPTSIDEMDKVLENWPCSSI